MAHLGTRGHAESTATGRGRGLADHDLPIVGTGVLALISSFLPWFGARYTGLNSSGQFTTFTDSVNAWSAGATAWLPVVLMLIAGALAAARLMAGRRGRPLGMSDSRMSAIMLGLGIASLVLIAIRWASLPRFYGTYFGAPGLATGARAGLILGLVSAILLTLLALRRMKVTRDQERRGAGWTGGEHGPLAGYRGGRAERGVTGRDREYAGRPGEEQQRGVTGEPGARSDRARGNPDFPGRDTGDRWNP